MNIQNIFFQQNRPASLPHIRMFKFSFQHNIQIESPQTGLGVLIRHLYTQRLHFSVLIRHASDIFFPIFGECLKFPARYSNLESIGRFDRSHTIHVYTLVTVQWSHQICSKYLLLNIGRMFKIPSTIFKFMADRQI